MPWMMLMRMRTQVMTKPREHSHLSEDSVGTLESGQTGDFEGGGAITKDHGTRLAIFSTTTINLFA